MAQAILIDVEKRNIRTVNVKCLKDMQDAVKGLITTAMRWENGDYCFVDDEGLLKPQEFFFMLEDCPQPFAGNGLVVGPEDENGELLDVGQSIVEVSKQVTFLNRLQVYLMLQEEVGNA